MKVGVDAGCLGITDERLKVGVYHIVKDTLQELSKIDKKNKYLLYSFYPIEKSLMHTFGKNMRNIVISSRGWLKIALPFRLMVDKPDIFLGANQALPLRVGFLHGYKAVSIFYDIAFEALPQLYAYAGDLTKLRVNSLYAAQHSNLILSISQKTKEDLVSFYKISSKKIKVAYPPVTVNTKGKPHKWKYPYFLFVGAFKKSKNIPVLLQAFAKFANLSKKTYGLILLGGDKWLDEEIQKTFSSLPKKIKNLIHIQPATGDKTKIGSFYKGAAAFVSPSIYEGFGLPFAEAMICGCPVIGSTAGSVPEIVGKAGVIVDPYDLDGLAKGMVKITTNITFKKKLIAEGKIRAKEFTKGQFAKAIYSIISSYENAS